MNENLQRLETKVENQGSTPQGKVSAAEWNILVAAVKALDAAGIDTETLAEYLKQYQYITTPELEELLGGNTGNLDGVVDLKSAQVIEGLKDFANGLKLGGMLIRYDAETNTVFLSANVASEGGFSSFAKKEGFKPPTIMDAILVDGDTIIKENGVLVAVGRTGEGGSSGDGDITDEDVVFCVIDEEDDGSTGDGGGISDEALQEILKDYVKTENLPTALPNPKALSFGSKTYNGSSAVTLAASDLGALTSHQTIYKLTFTAGKFSETSFTANSAKKTVNIPSSVSHLTGGTLDGDLVVDGDFQADHVTSLSTSDERLKENIRTFSATEMLQSMGGVKQYEYTEQEVKRNPANAGTHIGFIYQNVEKSPMADKMCCKRVDGYGALNYLSSDYQALLAAVILEQAEEIRQLKEIIKKIA
jgi:hypothetical protein